MSEADIAFPHLGIYISHLPKGIVIGNSFTIAYYGIILATGMLAGLFLARWQAKRTGQNPDIYMDYAIWGILFAIVGARLYYVVFSWDYYKENWLEIFHIRGGGLAIYGGVIAAVLTAVIYCRRKKYNFFLFADTAVPGLLIGQIIGRYGNFMNREAFGEYTDSLFAMRLKVTDVAQTSITASMKDHLQTIGGVQYIQVHPTFFYESMWNIMILLFILWYSNHKKQDGELFWLYLIGYGTGRCLIEGLRTDQLQLGSTGIAVSQVLSGCLVVGGILLFILRRMRAKKTSE